MKKYGESFITKPRWTSTDGDKVKNSLFQWTLDGDEYRLSLLGVVNGFLPLVGLVLAVRIDEGKNLQGMTIMKKWW